MSLTCCMTWSRRSATDAGLPHACKLYKTPFDSAGSRGHPRTGTGPALERYTFPWQRLFCSGRSLPKRAKRAIILPTRRSRANLQLSFQHLPAVGSRSKGDRGKATEKNSHVLLDPGPGLEPALARPSLFYHCLTLDVTGAICKRGKTRGG